MSLSTLSHRNAQIGSVCGLLLAILLTGGCGPKPSGPLPAKPVAVAPKANATAADTNLAEEYVSVFEDLPPHLGKDPFFPTSHRREPAPEVAATDPNAHVDPVLVLKGILRTRTHSQAVINNEVLEQGEEEPVRVPSGHVRVRCLEIGNDYVLIQVEGEAEPKRLVMEQKKY
jgi:hypothetical protein